MKYIVLLLLLLPVVSVRAQRLILEGGSVYIEAFGIRSDLISPAAVVKQHTLDDGSIRTPYHKGVSAYQNVLMSKKFKMAKQDAGGAANRTFYVHSGLVNGQDGRPGTAMTARASDNVGCDEYSELSDRSDKGKWRVPTINEYILMGNYLTSYNAPVGGFELPSVQYGRKMSFWYISSTTYEEDENQVYYFMWYPGFYKNAIGKTKKGSDAEGGGGRVRCIMDVD